MKPGDLVTVSLNEANPSSNVFIVEHVVQSVPEASQMVVILFHPLFPALKIAKNVSDLNLTVANPKDPYQRMLEFTKEHSTSLAPDDRVELDCLCMYFVLFRQLSKKQKQTLSTLCGKIAKQYLLDDLATARKTVLQNEHLILTDEHNSRWYTNFKEIYRGKKQITSIKQRDTVFNQAGFVLAQLHHTKFSKEESN